MAVMDNIQAASLIEAWIKYYEMDEPKAWEPDEYPSVKDACKSMRYAIQILRGKPSGTAAQLKEAIVNLDEFPEEHSMDEPEEWEKENAAFVKQALEAIRYTVDVLKKQK
ncbi:hypothetical protein [Paenibacillus agricola]|uniref:Phage protein n=1 Tax=Paenibacillus agricola TaxID=2716264 RepID=A0ABX0JE65_9BACL|nr:hypothetical protein [Paenibacillus agricola]NHN32998.1 hypothetical protein [Paenibacillus agricola]